MTGTYRARCSGLAAAICASRMASAMATAYQNLVHRGPGDAWLVGALGVLMIALAVFSRTAYIRVDDSAIIFEPKLLSRSSYDRREVARIRASLSPLTRRTLVLRSDGSTLRSTSGLLWGGDGLQSLADYLGVPFEGWGSTPT
jgi:hypothetical protein